MQLIDLSHPITESMPVYPDDPPVKIISARLIQQDGYEAHSVNISTHAGTHIDAPSHMIINGKNLDQFPLEKFTGRGVYIPVPNKRFDLPTITATTIQEGDIVLFHTGMSERYHTDDYFIEYPAFPKELAEYLVQKKVSMIGIDTCSVDHQEFITHRILLQNDILILENLTNLELLTNKSFTISAFPLNLALDGSPTRVVASIVE